MRPYLTLHSPADAARHYEAGLWQSDTFYGLLRQNASANGDVLALVDSRRQLTWAQVLEAVDGVAAELRNFGIVSGDRVCAWMSNRIELPILMLACSREGFACNPSLHRSHTTREVVSLVRALNARALFTETGWGADSDQTNLHAALADLPSLKALFDETSFPSPSPNLTNWNRNPDLVSYLAFTSGTTGKPKCAMHSDNTLLANARELVRDWHLQHDTVLLSLSPLSHHIAWVAFAQWLLSACQFVVNDPPEGQSILDWIHSTGATYLMGVPTHAIDILEEQERRGMSLGKVSTFYMAGSAIPPSLCSSLIEQRIKPQNVYGMTENSSHQYTMPHDRPDVISNTCGRGGQAYQVRIFDTEDQNRELPAGQTGQIGGKGAALMLGYFDNQAATEDSFNERGWFMSGDLGKLDSEGNLTVLGRLKETIIRGGRNIYPSKIEELVLHHPQVNKCACVPVPDSRLGERVCLVVDGAANSEEILAHLAKAGLSKYDLPEFFARVHAFPLTPSGKILKRTLIEMLASGKIAHEAVRRRNPAVAS